MNKNNIIQQRREIQNALIILIDTNTEFYGKK
jgi:hypothetical protein